MEPAIDFVLNPIVVMLLAALFLIGIAYMGSAARRADQEKWQERAKQVNFPADGVPEDSDDDGDDSDEDSDEESDGDDSDEEDEEDEDGTAGVSDKKKNN